LDIARKSSAIIDTLTHRRRRSEVTLVVWWGRSDSHDRNRDFGSATTEVIRAKSKRGARRHRAWPPVVAHTRPHTGTLDRFNFAKRKPFTARTLCGEPQPVDPPICPLDLMLNPISTFQIFGARMPGIATCQIVGAFEWGVNSGLTASERKKRSERRFFNSFKSLRDCKKFKKYRHSNCLIRKHF